MTAKLLVGSCVVFGAVTTLTMACNSGASHGTAGLGSGGGSAGGGKNAGAGAGMVASARADEGGTRLKANAITGTDGSKHYVGTFRDSQRSEDCSFTTVSDGSLRCLPPTLAVQAYGDDHCSQPLAHSDASCTALPKYIGVSDTCGHLSVIYDRGAAYTAAQVWTGGPSNCYASDRGDQNFVAASAPVDLSSFVAGSLAPE